MKLNNIDNGKDFDWGMASKVYAKFRDIYPDEYYQAIINLGYCLSGQKVLDIATGTGVLPRSMYKYGAKWTGADVSHNQIEYAKKMSKEMDINYIVSSAEELDFHENTFDIIIAAQCFMYFDKKILMPKIHKWLKPNGHLLILSMDWLPFESNIAKTSEDLILKYNPNWTGCKTKRYEIKTPDGIENLFEVSNKIAFDTDIEFTRETWHGRIKACRGIGAGALTKSKYSDWENEHLDYLKTVDEKFTIPHYITILDLKNLE